MICENNDFRDIYDCFIKKILNEFKHKKNKTNRYINIYRMVCRHYGFLTIKLANESLQ